MSDFNLDHPLILGNELPLEQALRLLYRLLVDGESPDDIEENMRKLQRQVTENVSLLHQLRPFLCGREDCAIRVPVAALENVGAKAVAKCPRKKKDEEGI